MSTDTGRNIDRYIEMYRDGDTLVLIIDAREKQGLSGLVGSLVMLGTGNGNGVRLTTFAKDGRLALSFHAAQEEFENAVRDRLRPVQVADVAEAEPVRHESPSGMPADHRFRKGRYSGKTPEECVASDGRRALQYLHASVFNAKEVPEEMLKEITGTVRRAAREALGPDGRLLGQLREDRDGRCVNRILAEYLLAVPQADLAGMAGLDAGSGYRDIAASIRKMSAEQKRSVAEKVAAYLSGVRTDAPDGRRGQNSQTTAEIPPLS